MTRAPIAFPSWTALEPRPPDAQDDQRLAGLELRDALEPVERRGDRVGEDGQHRRRHRRAAGRMSASTGRITYSANAPSTSTPIRVTCGLMLGRPARRPRVVGRGRDVVERDLVARRDPGHAVAERIDHAGRLVARARRAARPPSRSRPSGGNVRAADPARLDPDPDLTRPRLRDGPLGEPQRLRRPPGSSTTRIVAAVTALIHQEAAGHVDASRR